jgi:uncharacterized protein
MIYRIFFLLLFSISVLTISSTAQENPANKITGDWQGVLDAGAVKLRIVLHVKNENNKLLSALDSPDQGANGIPIDTIAFDNSTLKFTSSRIGATYEGTLKGEEIIGKFSQGGVVFPLNLKRGTAASIAPLKRPQTPVKPYPYDEQEIEFENKSANIKLAGTLTLPRTKAPFPVVVLITGSGPQDRNESLLGHQPFLVLSDHLTRQGIAVLRYDDRGVAKSKGDFGKATSEDFASDVLSAVAYLKTRKEINPKKIGLIGHSEGGMIAPMCATKSSDISFIVLMAGPGVTGEEIIYEQGGLLMLAEGSTPDEAARNRKLQEKMIAVLKSEKDEAAAEKKLREVMIAHIREMSEAQKKKADENPGALVSQIKSMNNPWFRFFVTYDPRTALRQIKIPVLAINGELDLQVSSKQNLPEIAKALKAAGNKKFQTVELPKLNHLFQSTKTGAFSEYGKIEETISPAALTVMSNWVKQVSGVR